MPTEFFLYKADKLAAVMGSIKFSRFKLIKFNYSYLFKLEIKIVHLLSDSFFQFISI